MPILTQSAFPNLHQVNVHVSATVHCHSYSITYVSIIDEDFHEYFGKHFVISQL